MAKEPESAAGKRVQAAVKAKKAIPKNGKKDNLSSEGKREEAERGRGQASRWRVLRDIADLGTRVPGGGSIAKALPLTRPIVFSVSCFLPAPAREVRRRLMSAVFRPRICWRTRNVSSPVLSLPPVTVARNRARASNRRQRRFSNQPTRRIAGTRPPSRLDGACAPSSRWSQPANPRRPGPGAAYPNSSALHDTIVAAYR